MRFHRQEGLRTVRSRRELLSQILEPRIYTSRVDVRESLIVDARCSAVSAAAPVRLGENVLAADLVPQAVESKAPFGLGFRL